MKLNGKRILWLSIFSLFTIYLISDFDHIYKMTNKLVPSYQKSNSKYQNFNQPLENGILNGIFGKIVC